MALRGIRVLEFTGLAPAPFCGKILSDFGATVTRIDRSLNNPIDCFKEGKETIALNIKNEKSQEIIRKLCKKYDVLLEPYRPGKMEKLNLGPQILMKDNPKLIYARLTGFGQNGPLAQRAGHDINYIALSGALSFLGRKGENPTAPINLLADFAGGGLLCAFGICVALLERHKSGKGQIVDSSMVEGAAYVASWLMKSQTLPIWMGARGENVLDTGAFFYDTYETKDGKFMSVGAIEPQFYTEFIEGLGLEGLSQYGDNKEAKKLVSDKFLTKTQAEWSEIFEKTDGCVFPVLDLKQAMNHAHNKQRRSFELCPDKKTITPKPAPRLSRTPGDTKINSSPSDPYSDAFSVLGEIGLNNSDILRLAEENVIILPNKGKL